MPLRPTCMSPGALASLLLLLLLLLSGGPVSVPFLAWNSVSSSSRCGESLCRDSFPSRAYPEWNTYTHTKGLAGQGENAAAFSKEAIQNRGEELLSRVSKCGDSSIVASFSLRTYADTRLPGQGGKGM